MWFYITGDILGPALSNLDHLVRMPTGCGEQNMVRFVPNILVLDYLTSTRTLDEKIKMAAIENMEAGASTLSISLKYNFKDETTLLFRQVNREKWTWPNFLR